MGRGRSGPALFQPCEQPFAVPLGRPTIARVCLPVVVGIELVRERDGGEPVEALPHHGAQSLPFVRHVARPTTVQQVELVQIERTKPREMADVLRLGDRFRGRERARRSAHGEKVFDQNVVGSRRTLEIQRSIDIRLKAELNAPFGAAVPQEVFGGLERGIDPSQVRVVRDIRPPVEGVRQGPVPLLQTRQLRLGAFGAVEAALGGPVPKVMTGRVPRGLQSRQIGMEAKIAGPIEIRRQSPRVGFSPEDGPEESLDHVHRDRSRMPAARDAYPEKRRRDQALLDLPSSTSKTPPDRPPKFWNLPLTWRANMHASSRSLRRRVIYDSIFWTESTIASARSAPKAC